MANLLHFEADLNNLFEKLSKGEEGRVKTKLNSVRERLIGLHKKNQVKINHSVMEFLCAKELIAKGYEVDVEHTITDTVNCDIFGEKDSGNTIIEIETGFVFPDHALDPLTYTEARVASKISRYAGYTNKFSLGTLPNNILNIPELFLKPPRYRTEDEVAEVKASLDVYYKNPPISIEEIQEARLHTIFLIHVDEGRVWEIDPEAYIESTSTSAFGMLKRFYRDKECCARLSR